MYVIEFLGHCHALWLAFSWQLGSFGEPQVLWLDLWNSEFSQGIEIQIEDLTAG